ncbi:MAG: ParB/RepB/Spo0J family partition protein [Patescibacteria group bacterium]|jgi:ParB family chromosome partitioning protein
MSEMRSITLASIDANPWQPRQEFNAEELTGLAQSIKEHGILQPLVVTEEPNGRYQLIAGERRFRAAKQAGLSKVFVIVRKADEQERLSLAIVENIQRKDLNPIERAEAFRRLMQEFKLTQAAAAEKVGKTRSAVANALRLLDLPEQIQEALRTNRISEGHAKVIAGLPEPQQIRFFDRLVAGNFSVRETEQAVRKLRQKSNATSSNEDDGDDLLDHYRGLLEGELATKVEINDHEGSGALTIHFYSEEELRRVIKKILGKKDE